MESPKLEKYESLCFHPCVFMLEKVGGGGGEGKDRESLDPP